MSMQSRLMPTIPYLYHLMLPLLARGSDGHVVPRHTDDALDAEVVCKDGYLVKNQVPDADAPPETVPHVGGDPVAVDGECGKHGGTLGGRYLEDVGEAEMGEAGDFQGGEGEADGVAEEVGEHGGEVIMFALRRLRGCWVAGFGS